MSAVRETRGRMTDPKPIRLDCVVMPGWYLVKGEVARTAGADTHAAYVLEDHQENRAAFIVDTSRFEEFGGLTLIRAEHVAMRCRGIIGEAATHV